MAVPRLRILATLAVLFCAAGGAPAQPGGVQFAYRVSPSGQAATGFLSIAIGVRSIVFENLQHDFPQRVAYERNGEQLLAWIEGPRQGQMRRIEYPYRRVACAAD